MPSGRAAITAVRSASASALSTGLMRTHCGTARLTCEVPCDLDACRAAAIGGDRILEVEDHGVGAARRRLREAFRAVTRNEQH